MRVFVAGGTGAIGRRLVPLLIQAGHDVTATTRTPGKLHALQATGAKAVVLDAFDAGAVKEAVANANPEVVIDQLTALSGSFNLRKFDDFFAQTNRLRIEGTDNLMLAARAAKAKRFVAQSYTGWTNERAGGPIKTEDDPLDPNPTDASRKTMASQRHLESSVMAESDLEGIVLRYGNFYGPGTSVGHDGEITTMIRRRMLPVVGGGTGVWSFVHIEDAAAATVLAIDRGEPGIYNIVDDDPAPVSQWLPYLAQELGAKPPLRLPVWLARPMIGEHGISLMTAVRGSSNSKARRELGWVPTYPSWREGFRHGLG